MRGAATVTTEQSNPPKASWSIRNQSISSDSRVTSSPLGGIGERVCTCAEKLQMPSNPGRTRLLKSCWAKGMKSGK